MATTFSLSKLSTKDLMGLRRKLDNLSETAAEDERNERHRASLQALAQADQAEAKAVEEAVSDWRAARDEFDKAKAAFQAAKAELQRASLARQGLSHSCQRRRAELDKTVRDCCSPILFSLIGDVDAAIGSAQRGGNNPKERDAAQERVRQLQALRYEVTSSWHKLPSDNLRTKIETTRKEYNLWPRAT